MKTDYTQGWAKSAVVDAAPGKAHAPDRAVPASDVMSAGSVPVFFAVNPATGKAVSLPSGMKAIGDRAPAAGAGAQRPARHRRQTWTSGSRMPSDGWPSRRPGTAPRTCRRSTATILDDLDFGGLAKLFALKGHKQIPFSGFYIDAREHRQARCHGRRTRLAAPDDAAAALADAERDPGAEDGRSASIRSRLFQPGSSRTRGHGLRRRHVSRSGRARRTACGSCGASPSTSSTSSRRRYEGGWSAARPARAVGGPSRVERHRAPAGSVPPADPVSSRTGAAAPSTGGPGSPAGGPASPAGGPAPAAAAAPANNYPPDIPLTKIEKREEGFRGGTGEAIAWPGIPPMWFHYRNPVSGRVPERYWPDCVPCLQYPETSMKNHGVSAATLVALRDALPDVRARLDASPVRAPFRPDFGGSGAFTAESGRPSSPTGSPRPEVPR